MTSVFSPVKEMKPNEYRRVTDVTYLGVVYGTMAALKRMLPRNRAPRGMAGIKKRCEASSARLYLFSIDINSAACSFDAPQYYAMTIKEQRPATRLSDRFQPYAPTTLLAVLGCQRERM